MCRLLVVGGENYNADLRGHMGCGCTIPKYALLKGDIKPLSLGPVGKEAVSHIFPVP